MPRRPGSARNFQGGMRNRVAWIDQPNLMNDENPEGPRIVVEVAGL